jgi:hypothetical protein
MADFSDVIEFAHSHRRCGGLATTIRPEPAGGYFLTITCACSVVLDRRVTADEASHVPFASAAPAAPSTARAMAPRRSARPRRTPSPELERAIQNALAAEETAAKASVAVATEGPSPTIAPVAPLAASVVRETVTAALDAQERLRAGVGAQPAPRKSRALWLVAAALLGLAALVAFFYVASELDLEAPIFTRAVPKVRTAR